MILETKRLILRPWKDSDAADLYRYAQDPDVGPSAGWPPHKDIEESRKIIQTVFCGRECYAICLKTDGAAIGCIELMLNGHTQKAKSDDECELGYWLGKPYWGRGIVPEAASELLRHGFKDLGMKTVWCGYYDGNDRSRRVQEKLGFRHQWTVKDETVPLLREKRISHVNSLTREDYDEYFDDRH